MARPSEYDFDMCKVICQRVTEGEHIKTVLDSNGSYPSFPTWCNWKRENDELFNLYTKAIQDKAEMVTFEINQTLQEMRDGTLEAPVGRIIIDTLKWYAAKFYPKMYGEKIDVTSDNKPIQSASVSISFDGAMLQASNVQVIEPESNKS